PWRTRAASPPPGSSSASSPTTRSSPSTCSTSRPPWPSARASTRPPPCAPSPSPRPASSASTTASAPSSPASTPPSASGPAPPPTPPPASSPPGSRAARSTAPAPAARRRSERSHGDDELALGVSLAQVTQRLRGVAQRVAPLHHRGDLPGREQLPQGRQVCRARRRDDETPRLARPRRGQADPEDVIQRPEQPAALGRPDQDEGRPRVEHPPARRPRPAPGDGGAGVVAGGGPGARLTGG